MMDMTIIKCTLIQLNYLNQLQHHMNLHPFNTGDSFHYGSIIYNEIITMIRDKQYYKRDGHYYNNQFKRFSQKYKFKYEKIMKNYVFANH